MVFRNAGEGEIAGHRLQGGWLIMTAHMAGAAAHHRLQQAAQRARGHHRQPPRPQRTQDGGLLLHLGRRGTRPDGADDHDPEREFRIGQAEQLEQFIGDPFARQGHEVVGIFMKNWEDDDDSEFCAANIDFVDAALGGELEVPTLDGRVKLKVPAETQTGKLFKLRGKGVTPVRGGGVGDLLCRVVVETPVNLTSKQKDLLKEFQATMKGGKYSPKQSSWFDGVKKFFGE